MKKRQYIKPNTDIVTAEMQSHILTASQEGKSMTFLGEQKHQQNDTNTTLSDDDIFEMHSKSYNAWSTWDE